MSRRTPPPPPSDESHYAPSPLLFASPSLLFASPPCAVRLSPLAVHVSDAFTSLASRLPLACISLGGGQNTCGIRFSRSVLGAPRASCSACITLRGKRLRPPAEGGLRGEGHADDLIHSSCGGCGRADAANAETAEWPQCTRPLSPSTYMVVLRSSSRSRTHYSVGVNTEI